MSRSSAPRPGDHLDGRFLLAGELSEEQVEHVLAVSVVRPDYPVPLVVDDHGDVRMALAVAGLVHADRREMVERRGHRGLEPFGDPMGYVARGAPCDVREPAHGLLVRDRHRPRALPLEIPGEPAAGLRPRRHRHDHAAPGAVHARTNSALKQPKS